MKVAIIGTAPSMALAPFQDKSWAVWACSQGNQGKLPRVDLWFELHSICDMLDETRKAWSIPYFGWLKAQEFPIYMQEKNDLVPGAKVFPLKMLIEKFTNPDFHARNWLASQIAMMMAFAIHQMTDGDEIALFGVDMAADFEHYTGQKAGCLRWIEIAQGKGIKVTVPDESCLANPMPIYAYEEATRFGRVLNVRMEMATRLHTELDQKIHTMELERAYAKGQINCYQYMKRTFVDGLEAELDDGKQVIVGDGKRASEIPTAKDFKPTDSGLLVPRKAANGSGKPAEA